jgi:hypothetical protein
VNAPIPAAAARASAWPAPGLRFDRAGNPLEAAPRRRLLQWVNPRYLLAATAVVVCVAAVAPNGLLSAYAIAVLLVLGALLYRPAEPVFGFAALYQWLQAGVLLLSADLRGQTWDAIGVEAPMIDATWLSLTGVLAFGIGAWLGQGPRRRDLEGAIGRDARRFSLHRLGFAWLIAFAAEPVLLLASDHVGGLAQIVRSSTQVKWVVVFMLAVAVIAQRRGYRMLAAIVALEVAYGLVGYFSAFRSVFIIVGLALLSGERRLSARKIAWLAALGCVLLYLAVVWTAVKQDLRSYANQGSKDQVVDTTWDEQLTEFVRLAAQLDLETLAIASDELVERIGYVHYFSYAIDYVPDIVPYEEGRLWLAAVRHVLVPRLIDPDKPTLDDSEETAKYTGVGVAGANEGSSIGLGYMAESYIDFGSYGMHVPIFLLGVLSGLLYRILSRRHPMPLVGLACATVIVAFNAYQIETSNAKILGGLVTSFLIFFALLHFFPSRIVALLAREPSRDAWKVRIEPTFRL